MVDQQHVYVREEIDAPAQAVWRLVRDFGDVNAWVDGEVVKTEGTGIGMVRHVDAAAGRVVERCEAHDERAMSFAYRLLASPWPFENYVATVKLSEREPGKTTIEWSSIFEVDNDNTQRVIRGLERTYRDVFIARLRAATEGRPTTQ